MNWLNANKISLNSTKTELLLYHPKHKPLNYDIKVKINGRRLLPSKCVKYLGVIIDPHLSWNHHIDFVCNKLKRANGALSKLRHFLSKETLVSLYYALFHSHLSYSVQVWGLRENQQTRRILTLQKQALRLITFSDYNSHSLPLFASLNILSFFDYIKYSNIIFLHNCINHKLPSAVCKSINVTEITSKGRLHQKRTKSGLLRLPKVKTISYGNYSLTYQSVVAWNLLQHYLPVDDLSTININRLKYLVKFYFLSSYI